MKTEKIEQIKLLLDIGELNWVFQDSSDIQSLLQNIVKMVAKHMKADICSIYFFDEKKKDLVLKANVGLNPELIGKLRIKLGEGIVGTCLEKLKPISSSDGVKYPKFKYSGDRDEEHFKSFLAVPILNGDLKVGVLAIRRKKPDDFVENDVLAVRVIASQLANLMENVRLMTSLREASGHTVETVKNEVFNKKFLKGKPASRGYCYAPVYTMEDKKGFGELEKITYKRYTLKDFTTALEETEAQIVSLQNEVKANLSDAASMIFTSHLLILKDRNFIETISENIRNGKNPPEAVISVSKKYINTFLQSPNEYLIEKSKDIEDLAFRITSNIIKKEITLPGVKGRIVIAREMYPSDILKLASEQVKGVVLTSGGVTSHVSILARSLDIPMIIVNDPSFLWIDNESKILMDAELGNIYINPQNEVLDEFKDMLEHVSKKQHYKMLPETFTKDGVKIELMSNVNLLKDLDTLKDLVCDGIGLYRSEFPFLIRSSFPSEEEQYFVYKKLIDGMPHKEVTFRTLDVGGDKLLSYSQGPKKENPFLGLRSIRFSLKNKGVFKEQIRAILRAGQNANLRIMFPMIFSIEEFIEAKNFIKECSDALKKEGAAHNGSPKIGMMVEIPAVVEIIDDFAKAADFFSIGTNDLVQYMLAVDRNNEEVADYYLPQHPSVLRAIKKVAQAAVSAGIDVSVCGDMANQSKYIPFLLGVGIRKLSMNPSYLYQNQKIVTSLSMAEAANLADKVLKLSKIKEVENMLA